jgi:DNA adenine methylase
MKLPHPIPYQGSKRNLASQILHFFPADFERLIEPFSGSAAITIAAAYHEKGKRYIINDINLPLIDLFDAIINKPRKISKEYYNIWHEQHGNEEEHYYEIRNKFNREKRAEHLLFLLAKCVKAAVRYNAKGEFNQSLDKRRLGRNPEMMQSDIFRVSKLLNGKVDIHSTDYKKILDTATSEDLVYMDPPYQGTGLNGGFNYAGNIELNEFFTSLHELNKRHVPFLLSFDGRTGQKIHGSPVPESLQLMKIEINAGRSSQATLLNRHEYTYEVLYLSPSLLEKIDLEEITDTNVLQSELFVIHA